jgi:hypothetical protein
MWHERREDAGTACRSMGTHTYKNTYSKLSTGTSCYYNIITSACWKVIIQDQVTVLKCYYSTSKEAQEQWQVVAQLVRD